MRQKSNNLNLPLPSVIIHIYLGSFLAEGLDLFQNVGSLLFEFRQPGFLLTYRFALLILGHVHPGAQERNGCDGLAILKLALTVA